MCCDLAGSSRQHWLWDIARKRNEFLLFSIVLRILQLLNIGTIGLIQVGFSAKCTSPNEHFNRIENWKCQIYEFRLIWLDRITYNDFVCQFLETNILGGCVVKIASKLMSNTETGTLLGQTVKKRLTHTQSLWDCYHRSVYYVTLCTDTSIIDCAVCMMIPQYNTSNKAP